MQDDFCWWWWIRIDEPTLRELLRRQADSEASGRPKRPGVVQDVNASESDAAPCVRTPVRFGGAQKGGRFMNDEKIDVLLDAISERLAKRSNAGQPHPAPMGFQAGVPAQQMGVMSGSPSPVITGVSVPLVWPMPDGRELAIRIHFTAESAQSWQHIQALVNWCMQAYGQYLAAKRPWSGKYNSNYERDRYSDRRRY